MIDEKKLIEDLESLPLIHGRYDHEHANSDFISGIETWHETVLKKINEQPKVSEWVPVVEGLPEDTEEEFYPLCIVTIDNGDVCLGVFRHDDKTWYTSTNEGEGYYSTRHKVIAWMPLPEPYKAGD